MAIRMSGMVSGLDTEAIIKSLMEVQTGKKTKVENQKTKHEWKQEKWTDLNKKIYDFYTGSLSKLRLQGTFNTKAATTSNDNKIKLTADSTATNGTSTLQINSLASSQYVTGAKLSDAKASTKLVDLGFTTSSVDENGVDIEGDVITITNGVGDKAKTVEFKVTKDSTVKDFVSSLSEAGLNANFDEKQGRFFISSASSGADNSFTITSNQVNGSSPLTKLGLDEIDSNITDVTGGEGLSIVTAKDSEVILNGALLKSSSNTITANGLTMDLQGTTGAGEVITLKVSNDVDGMYNMVKDLLKEYNGLIKEMNELYYADSAKDYDILTEEQKDSMSDEEVEKWEGKIKGALLRRDSTLGSLLSSMKNAMQSSVVLDGKKFSLSTFGIQTSKDYTEKGLLHIWGDSDDEASSGQEDKLRKALQDNPDETVKALSGIFQNLYSALNEKTKPIEGLKSAMKFYNDKQLNTEKTKYEKQISDWTDKLADIEDRYYKQFSAMEVALSKLQSQSSSLSGFFGQ